MQPMRIGRIVIVGLVLAFSIGSLFHTFFSPSGWSRRQKALADLAAIRAENATIEAQVAKLRAEIKALKTRPEVQQHTVRDELGFVAPGDLIIELNGTETF